MKVFAAGFGVFVCAVGILFAGHDNDPVSGIGCAVGMGMCLKFLIIY